MSSNTQPPVAQNLRELLRRDGKTQEQLARELDVPLRTMQGWLGAAGHQPPWTQIVAMAAIFDVRPHYFYEDPADRVGA